MNKNRHIIGELQEFFANNDSSKAINSISTIMNSIRIQSKVIGSVNMSQFLLDYFLHGKEGKRSDKQQGLSKKQAEARYCKEHSDDEHIARGSAEYFASKIETAINMLKRSIIEGLRFDYLLVDSWFTYSELLKFVVSRHFGCHSIGYYTATVSA